MILDLVVRVLLMPVLIGQAIHLRRTVRSLPEPAGDRSGTVGSGPPLRVLVIGDSSAAGVGVAQQDDALLGQIISRLSQSYTISYDLVAVIGAKTSTALGWLSDLPQDHYDVVVTGLGVNDVTKATTLRRFLKGQQQLMARFREDYRAKLVVVAGLPPVGDFPLLPNPVRWVLGRQSIRFDRYLRALVARTPDCEVVTLDMRLNAQNMAADGFHPGPEVYAAWAHEVTEIIKAHKAQLDAA
ncbi:MAG: SGNH/GDSL hydrolase family protein [Yoonia sp.]|uniref:SGNH/GDSL hydrolase family protein n=1 Tax=Yoonia sp. TaxID=2212373 RepID=UPI003EF774BE